MVMREFMTAFGKLAAAQREAFSLRCSRGCRTKHRRAHRRVRGYRQEPHFRARDTLERLLLEGEARRPRGLAGYR